MTHSLQLNQPTRPSDACRNVREHEYLPNMSISAFLMSLFLYGIMYATRKYLNGEKNFTVLMYILHQYMRSAFLLNE